MYNELYEIWKRELESSELNKLPSSSYYATIAEYLKHLKEEGRMLDKKTVKTRLLRSEMHNVKRMLHELIQIRYKKLIHSMADNEKIPLDVLTNEEVSVYTDCSSVMERYQDFGQNILRGQLLKIETDQNHRNIVLRFFKDVPAIIGMDMESYGPFKVEDVASLPIENGKILIRQHLAEQVAVN